MIKFQEKFITAFLLFLISGSLFTVQAEDNTYHDLKSLNSAFTKLYESNKSNCALHEIAVSPGNNKVFILEIGTKLNSPAVFVAANLNGTVPVSSEAALFLAKEILKKDIENKWYILYNGNPDASVNFFKPVKFMDSRNQQSVNDDKDESTDEDSPEDLNKDGLITLMKVPDLTGDYTVDSKNGLVRKANKLKGETGMFKIYSEGIDNDNDGLYNEDPIGGVNVNENFPHKFKHFTNTGGDWAGSSPEAYGIIKFIYEHPDIQMALTFGEYDFLENLPKKSKRSINTDKIKVSRRTAQWMGLDPKTLYSIDDIKALAKENFPQRTFTTSNLASMLGLGEVKETFPKDLDYFNILSKKYKKHLKSKSKNIKAESIKDGGFEKWAYYHLGIPSFAISIWNVPLSEDSTINKKYLNELSIIKNKEQLLNNGFVDWTPFTHPQLGEIEIGGIAPYALNNPPIDNISDVIEKKVPFAFELAKYIPTINISKTQLSKISDTYYQAEVWVSNKGVLPWPLEMGRWNGYPAPVVLEVNGKNIEFVEGKKRTAISEIDGNSTVKISWIISTSSTTNLSVKLTSEQGWSDTKNFKL